MSVLLVHLADSFHGTPSNGPSEPSPAASHGNLSPQDFQPAKNFYYRYNVMICRNESLKLAVFV